MPIAQLINRPCTLTLKDSSGAEDDYGNKLDDENTAVETVCEAQPTRIAEPEAQGEVSDEDWTAFFLPGDSASLDTASAVDIEGLGAFDVVGRPPVMRNPRTQVDEYIAVRLHRIAGSDDA